MPEETGQESGQQQGEEGQTLDLNNPQIQAAINAASQKAVADAKKGWDEETAGIKKNRDEILEEKREFAKLGSLSEITERLGRLEALENEKAAADAGGDPKKFNDLVEEKAQAKYNAKATELSEAMKAKDDTISDLTAKLEASQKLAHRRFVESQVTRASLPEDRRIVHEGAWDQLITTLEPLIEAEEVAGIGEVARIKKDGALVPGEGPEGYMGVRELVNLSRQGKGPVPGISYCFVDSGSGSKTHSADTKTSGTTFGDDWFKLSDKQRLEYRREHGKDKTEAFIAESSQKQHSAAN